MYKKAEIQIKDKANRPICRFLGLLYIERSLFLHARFIARFISSTFHVAMVTEAKLRNGQALRTSLKLSSCIINRNNIRFDLDFHVLSTMVYYRGTYGNAEINGAKTSSY